MKSFVCVGDTHFPFANKDSIRRIIAYIKKHRPSYVVQMGDLYDFFSWSSFPFKRDVYTPQQEITKGREQALGFWESVRKASPSSKCYQLLGNHDGRLYKRLLKNSPEFASLYPTIHRELFTFPNVMVQPEEREELIVGGIMFMHGFRSRLGDHARNNNMPTVCGHSHTGGVVYIRRGANTLWELNCGFVGDPNCVPLSYTRQNKVSAWTQGFGVIDKYGPRFIPLPNG